MLRMMPHSKAITNMTNAAREDISRFHNHQNPTSKAPTARPGLSQKASVTFPCRSSSTIRWPPQKGQLRPVSQWKGHISIIVCFILFVDSGMCKIKHFLGKNKEFCMFYWTFQIFCELLREKLAGIGRKCYFCEGNFIFQGLEHMFNGFEYMFWGFEHKFQDLEQKIVLRRKRF